MGAPDDDGGDDLAPPEPALNALGRRASARLSSAHFRSSGCLFTLFKHSKAVNEIWL